MRPKLTILLTNQTGLRQKISSPSEFFLLPSMAYLLPPKLK